jgi:Ca-activated chloride channel family protein
VSASVPLALSLTAPWFLVLLLLVPLGVLAIRAAASRRKRHAVRMPATPTLIAVVAAQPSYRRWLPAALVGLAVVLLVIGMTRPERTVSVPVERASMMLVTDASGSMRAADVPPTRMDAARNAALDFLDGVPDQTRVGVVGFSSSPSVVQAPTTDREVARQALNSLDPDGGTATGDALATALDALKAEGDPSTDSEDDRPPGAILLLSDGATSAGEDPLTIADQAKQAGIPIYTVSLGTPDGQVDIGGQTLSVPPDPETMRAIAERSEGEAFSVDDGDELKKIYERVGARVATESQQREVTAWFAAGGFVALAIALGLGLRWRSRIG